MKANELMVGDLIYYSHTEDGIAPYKEVIRIKAEDLCRDACIIETHYEPIPLTPEILEKNGFTQCEPQGYDLYAKNKEGAGLYHILWQSEPYDYLEIAAYAYAFGEFNKLNIKYVHQLQHALRLCGIDKEIVL